MDGGNGGDVGVMGYNGGGRDGWVWWGYIEMTWSWVLGWRIKEYRDQGKWSWRWRFGQGRMDLKNHEQLQRSGNGNRNRRRFEEGIANVLLLLCDVRAINIHDNIALMPIGDANCQVSVSALMYERGCESDCQDQLISCILCRFSLHLDSQKGHL